MKANEKIIVFIVLAILSMVTAAVSFVANDIGSYRHWIAENKPAIMENFDHKDRHIRPDEERRMMDERHDKDFRVRLRISTAVMTAGM